MLPAVAAACFTWRSVSALQRQTYTVIGSSLRAGTPTAYRVVADLPLPQMRIIRNPAPQILPPDNVQRFSLRGAAHETRGAAAEAGSAGERNTCWAKPLPLTQLWALNGTCQPDRAGRGTPEPGNGACIGGAEFGRDWGVGGCVDAAGGSEMRIMAVDPHRHPGRSCNVMGLARPLCIVRCPGPADRPGAARYSRSPPWRR